MLKNSRLTVKLTYDKGTIKAASGTLLLLELAVDRVLSADIRSVRDELKVDIGSGRSELLVAIGSLQDLVQTNASALSRIKAILNQRLPRDR